MTFLDAVAITGSLMAVTFIVCMGLAKASDRRYDRAQISAPSSHVRTLTRPFDQEID